jgi:hypothetical protein
LKKDKQRLVTERKDKLISKKGEEIIATSPKTLDECIIFMVQALPVHAIPNEKIIRVLISAEFTLPPGIRTPTKMIARGI